MLGSSYFFLQGLLKITGESTGLSTLRLSTWLLLGTDANFWTQPHTECDVTHSRPGLVWSLSPGNRPQPLSPRSSENLFDTTVQKSLCIENRRLSLHRHFQLAHYVKINMHGHNWNVSCCLPCKSYTLFHGRRTPYFKYSVDKDLKMEDLYYAPLMVKWEDFRSSVLFALSSLLFQT